MSLIYDYRWGAGFMPRSALKPVKSRSSATFLGGTSAGAGALTGAPGAPSGNTPDAGRDDGGWPKVQVVLAYLPVFALPQTIQSVRNNKVLQKLPLTALDRDGFARQTLNLRQILENQDPQDPVFGAHD